MSKSDTTLAHPASHGHVDLETKERQWKMAGLLFIGSDFVFVMALFFSYLYLRVLNVNHLWRPSYVHPAGAISVIMVAALVVVSAGAYRWAVAGIRAGRQEQLRRGLALALLFLVADIVVQVYQMTAVQFGPQSGGFASSYFALAGYHVFHLCVGLLVGTGMLVRAMRAKFSAEHHMEVVVLGYFWYWIAIVAVAVALLPK